MFCDQEKELVDALAAVHRLQQESNHQHTEISNLSDQLVKQTKVINELGEELKRSKHSEQELRVRQ